MECIASAPQRLPRCEVEVCALILFGVSTMEIASHDCSCLDLGLDSRV